VAGNQLRKVGWSGEREVLKYGGCEAGNQLRKVGWSEEREVLNYGGCDTKIGRHLHAQHT
jgi:hypothetical protein